MNIAFLKECDKEYYNTGKVLVTDGEYDNLKDQLRGEFPNDSYFQTVGSAPAGSSVSLPYVLGSLNKTKADGTLLKWCNDNDIKELILSDKLDGVSIYSRFLDGKLVQASTRGNGYEGKDITEKVRLITPTCKGSGIREFRGEAVMTQNDCDKLGYSLPRSAVSGILNGDDQEHFDKCQFVSIIYYNVLGVNLDNYEQHYTGIAHANLRYPEFVTVPVIEELEAKMIEYFQFRKSYSRFDIDGIVVARIDDGSVGEDYYPSNMVAFKVNEKPVRCVVTNVVWEVKRSGKIQPVVHIEPVNIGGSRVSKATGFNKKFIEDNRISRGAEIGIVRSGDIIPYIVECYTKNDMVFKDIISSCPACGYSLDVSLSGVDLVCINHYCDGKMLYKIEHFLLAHEVEEITAKTIKKLDVRCIEELYSLSHDEIASIEGMGASRANTILTQLQKTLNTTPEKMLKSFGISGIGNSASDLILNTFGDLETVFTRNLDDFIKLDGIGDKLARNLFDGLRNNVSLYQFLKNRGLKFEEKVSMDLQGKIFTLTGKSDVSRNDLLSMIGSHGGMVKGISKKVDYLVTDDINSTSGKMKKAIQYGITIISYDDLLNIIS